MNIELDITPQIYQRGPNIKIFAGKKVFTYENYQNNVIQCEIQDAPTKITIMHYGKSDNDIKLENNKIIKDTGFTLNSIKFDDHKLTNEIFKFEILLADGQKLTGNNYFGHNCAMTFDINEPIDFWIFKIKNQSNKDNSINIDEFIADILS